MINLPNLKGLHLAGVVSITWWSFSLLFQGILTKYKHMRVLKNKREIQNYAKVRIISLFCYTGVFWCKRRLFPISYKYFTHVGMLQSRYKQCKVEWLSSTWSAFVRYFASSLFAISTTWILVQRRGGGGGMWGLKFLVLKDKVGI